jgi:hypothetical protein
LWAILPRRLAALSSPEFSRLAHIDVIDCALLDRAYGKPPQFNTGDATNFRKAVDISDDELAAIATRAKLTVV